MFRLGASPRFPDAGSWWHDPPPLGAADSPWDVTGIAAWQKHLEEDTKLSPLERDSTELLEADVPELEAIKMKIREMEKEDERFQGLQADAKHFIVGSGTGDVGWVSSEVSHLVGAGQSLAKECKQLFINNCLPFPSMTVEKLDADHRSIYVGNVDYGGTAAELESHFNRCGEINRVTILCDKFSGHPKGYAYIEFAVKGSVQAAAELDESTFRGRVIKVLPKRTNMPGISTTDRGGGRGRFHSRGGPPQRAGFYRGQRSRPHGRVYRGRGRIVPWYTPY